MEDQKNDEKGPETPTPDLGQLEKEEEKLATKLKSYCTLFGEEKRKTLKNSANILLELGKVYLKKATIEEGIEQKMSYIKSAVLLQAAIERFKIDKNSHKIEASKRICQELSESLLKFCNSSFQTKLYEISEMYFNALDQKRAEIWTILDSRMKLNLTATTQPDPQKLKVIESMDSISPIDIERILTPDREKKEISFAKEVQEINRNVTNFYICLMRDIALECLGLLPPQPCKFTIVGLGSVAREEATLYSDFEHIILLEEGIHRQENYHSILEYFRWFSVVFQVIVIGFGETIIPSVAVKSLNDFYSEDAGANWFYDNFTPNGISFDGMLPHACKIPIGRQQKTKKRPHTVELIKTPQKMAEYLTEKQQLKNGYHLGDVLRQTCLVYGDGEIYASFMQEKDHILQKEMTDIREMYTEMILRNATPNVRYQNLLFMDDTVFDSKPVFYRPLATYISVLSRIYKVEEKPTFEVVDQLYERKILGPHTYRKLKYAFATACEIRMLIYHKVNQQRHGTQMVDVKAMMGEEAIWICEYLISILKFATDSVIERGDSSALTKKEAEFTAADSPTAVLDLMDRGCIAAAIKLGEKLCRRMEQGDHSNYDMARLHYALFDCLRVAILYRGQHSLEYCLKAEVCYSKLMTKDLGYGSVQLHMSMAQIYKFLWGNFHYDVCDGCMSVCEKFFDIYFKNEEAQKEYDTGHLANVSYMYYESALQSSLNPGIVDEKLRTLLWDKTDNIECQLLRRTHLVHRSFQKRQPIENLREEIHSISTTVQRNTKRMLRPIFLQSWCVLIQVRMWWLQESVETLESVLRFHRSCSSFNKLREYNILVKGSWKLLCLCRLLGNRIVRQVAIQDKQRDGVLLQRLVGILWRGIQLSNKKLYGIYALSWVVHQKNKGRTQTLFLAHREMKNPQKKYWKITQMVDLFARCYFEPDEINDEFASLVSFAWILLAKSL